jgi:hypothetical protein
MGNDEFKAINVNRLVDYLCCCPSTEASESLGFRVRIEWLAIDVGFRHTQKDVFGIQENLNICLAHVVGDILLEKKTGNPWNHLYPQGCWLLYHVELQLSCDT